MSTCVDCVVTVTGYNPERKAGIIQSVKDHLDADFDSPECVEDTETNRKYLEFNSSFSISGEFKDYAQAIMADVWQANGEYCEVNVEMRFPEYAPVEELEGDAELYEELIIPAEA